MKKVFLLSLLLLFAACHSSDDSSSSGAQDSVNQPAEAEELTSSFMVLVNNHRKSLGLRSLVHAEELATVARGHSQNMASKSVAFGHTGFSARCAEARVVMGGGNLCAENVAMGQKTAQAVFNSWMNSSSHRANIENSRVTHCGLGIAKSSSGTLYWTHFFLEKN